MKILYFYQYFTTPKGSYGTRVYEFTTEWVKKGHDVTVVTSVYSKSDIRASKFLEDQLIEGVKLKIINVRVDNKQSFLKRVWTFLVYAIMSSYYALVLPADIVISSSGPISVGIPGLLAKIFRRKTLVFEVRDLWPEVLIELGVIKNKWIKKLAYKFEALCYRKASLVVGLSPGMKSYIESNHNHSNVISVTNAANVDLFATRSGTLEYGLVPKKYVIYTGNIGEVNNSYWLYQLAIELNRLNRSDMEVVLVGDGQQRMVLEKQARENNLTNFRILGSIPKEKLVTLVQNALFSIVPLKDSPVLDTSSPNKFFESMAAGVPVIQNTNGWMKEFLEKHNVGFTLDANDTVSLAKLVIDSSNNPDEMHQMGIRASLIAREQFDKVKLAQTMLSAIEKLVPAR